jgi:ketosteroid isomerase-like protein
MPFSRATTRGSSGRCLLADGAAGGRGGVYHGHRGLRSFFLKYHEAWEDIQYEGAELVDAGGEHVISVDTERTRGRTSGVETELTQYAVWTIRDGKVVKVVWFPTRADALEAAGLSE